MRTLVAVVLSLAFAAGVASESPAAAPGGTALPGAISAVMKKPRYAKASWSLLVTDLATGKTVYALDPDRLAFSGSVRKLFSVGVALNQLGAGHRFTTPVYRSGSVDANGALRGNLVLVGAGDLTLGGRLLPSGNVAITTFDHNDANNLGTATSPRRTRCTASTISRAGPRGRDSQRHGQRRNRRPPVPDVRVPNGNLFITPLLVNENMVDVTASPAQQGAPARCRLAAEDAGVSRCFDTHHERVRVGARRDAVG